LVALEPSEPLLLYIVTTVDAVSMVLVVERPEPHQHQEPKAEEALESKPQNYAMEPVPSPSPSSHRPIQAPITKRPLGPNFQGGGLSDSRGQDLPDPEPMEVDPLEPPP
jgi:hypothetical protein